MRVNQVNAKGIITKCNIPGIDFVINPYIGCQHACIYCYAEYMKRFTGHLGETWGEFLDVKNYDFEKIRPEKYDGKTILFSSVTDPYTPLEVKYENTRRILEKLVGTKARVEILTKSRLVERDIDLFKQFENISVGVSLNSLDEDFARLTEPKASKPRDRLKALQNIANEGIPTWIFISPVFPRVSDWAEIIEASQFFNEEFHFENLNFRSHNVSRIMKLIEKNYPHLLDYYRKIKSDYTLWNEIEEDIENYCGARRINCKIEFHHGGFTNS
ncbi:MAG: radical SAM protein [Candidatus Thorarchaeota archaeon]